MAVEAYQQRRAQELGLPQGTGKLYGDPEIRAFIATPFPSEPFRADNIGVEQRQTLVDTANGDFNQAIKLAKGLADKTAAFTLVDISIAQAKVGLEPAVSASDILSLADQWQNNTHYQLNAQRLQVKGALLLMATGDVSQALVTAKHVFNDAMNYSDLIRVAHESNLGARPVKHLGYLSGNSAVEDTLNLAYSHFGDLRYNTAPDGIAGFALNQRLLLGLPVEEALVDEWAKVYGKGITSNWRHLDIAAKYAKAGFPDRAEEIWKETSDEPGQPKRARVLSEIAIAWAEQDHDPLYAVDETVKLLDGYNYNGNRHHFHKGEVLANLAIAEHKIGGDSTFYIEKAIAEAAKEPSNLRSGVLLSIAEAQDKYLGIDPSETLKQALDWADEIFTADPDYCRDNSYGVDTMTYEDISEGFAKAKMFTGSRIALDTIDLYKDGEGQLDDMAMDNKISGLTSLAEMEAKASLID